MPMHQFSQSSLQDYTDCPRRYQLKYLEKLAWPAVIAEPIQQYEADTERGAAFHHRVHQHHLGIPAQAISAHIQDDDVRDWWAAYLKSDYAVGGLPGTRYPELLLHATVAGVRVVAKYDLLILTPQRALIIDWKTAKRPPTREALAGRWQTWLYPYVLVQAGAELNSDDAPIPPEQVQMVYWFANAPHAPVIFDYSADQHAATHDKLAGLLPGIVAQTTFDKTPDVRHCRYCVYRSLCDRGISAGGVEALDDVETLDTPSPFDVDIPLDQIGEVSF